MKAARSRCISCWAQVCLAAEKCGHLDFDIRRDMWWRAQGFHCGDTPAGEVSFADIFWKVNKKPDLNGRACLSALSRLSMLGQCGMYCIWIRLRNLHCHPCLPPCDVRLSASILGWR